MAHPLLLLVFIHNDLSDYDREKIYNDHFKWLGKELETLSGRGVAIVLIEPSKAPRLCDHGYKLGTPEQALYSWHEKIERYKDDYSNDAFATYNDHTRKFLLLTRDNLSDTVAGIASHKGYFAIASINSTQTPAHEVGHMFGALHEDFEVYHNGWWDETIMASGSIESSLRRNAKRFSDKNRENIRQHLAEYA